MSYCLALPKREDTSDGEDSEEPRPPKYVRRIFKTVKRCMANQASTVGRDASADRAAVVAAIKEALRNCADEITTPTPTA